MAAVGARDEGLRTKAPARYATIDTAIGPVYLAYDDRRVVAVMPATDAGAFEAAFARRFGRPAALDPAPPVRLLTAVRAWLAGRTRRELRFDLDGLSEFERAVLAKALEIPRGEVRPYGWIAREIGRPKAVRAVGSALGRNPIPLLIPCHRVVRSDGTIGEYALGAEAKRRVLLAEGVDVAALERQAGRGVRFVGTATTRIFCLPTCRHAQRITPDHRLEFRSERAARAAGYRPCRICRPAELVAVG